MKSQMGKKRVFSRVTSSLPGNESKSNGVEDHVISDAINYISSLYVTIGRRYGALCQDIQTSLRSPYQTSYLCSKRAKSAVDDYLTEYCLCDFIKVTWLFDVKLLLIRKVLVETLRLIADVSNL